MYSITFLVHLLVFKYFKKCKTSGKKFIECKMCVCICLLLLSPQNFFLLSFVDACRSPCASL